MKKALFVLILLAAAAMPFIGYAQATAAEPTCTNGFCTLTQINSIKFASNATELPVFLNSLYKICIGLAAALAVLQIIRAGVTWSTAGDSHEKISEAKGLITMSIAGLVLVLSPVIVFSIINPDILSLKIGDIDKLTLPDSADITPSQGDGSCDMTCPTGQVCKEKKCVSAASGSCQTIANGQELKNDQETACCAMQTSCAVRAGTLGSNNTCACGPAVATGGPIQVTMYRYMPLTGSPRDLGPIDSDKVKYDEYIGDCNVAKGQLDHKYATAATCDASLEADKKYPTYAGYVKCSVDTITCF